MSTAIELFDRVYRQLSEGEIEGRRLAEAVRADLAEASMGYIDWQRYGGPVHRDEVLVPDEARGAGGVHTPRRRGARMEEANVGVDEEGRQMTDGDKAVHKFTRMYEGAGSFDFQRPDDHGLPPTGRQDPDAAVSFREKKR